MTAPNPAKSMRTPLSRVRSLGSSHSGTTDFWRQRITAVAMVLFAQILGSPLVAITMLLFIVASVWHMKIGMQVVIEDYVHSETLKLASIMANNFFSAVVALVSIYAILKLSSGV
jgi:succinate dehydrogenase / fumarate reductase membrane anchor subunit